MRDSEGDMKINSPSENHISGGQDSSGKYDNFHLGNKSLYLPRNHAINFLLYRTTGIIYSFIPNYILLHNQSKNKIHE